MMKDSLSFSDIRRISPKADLHRHLDGALLDEENNGDLISLALKYGVKLPTYDPKELAKKYDIRGNISVEDLLRAFSWPIAIMRSPEGLEKVAYEAVLDMARENIIYGEVRFAPSYHSFDFPSWYTPEDYEINPFKPMSMKEVVIRALQGLNRGMSETGIIVNLTLCVPRELQEKGEKGMKLATEIAMLAVEFQERGVVALDLACDEFSHPPDAYAEIFLTTKNSRIRRDPHAGEMGSDSCRRENIKTCLFNLAADGLGHALPLHEMPYEIEYMANKKIRVERNPVPDIAIRGEGNPGLEGIDVLLEEGVLVSVCSDDPALMRTSLTDNLKLVLDYYGWGEEELQKLVANGVKSGFYVNAKQEKRVRETFIQRGLDPMFLK
jgi:adenosine deaminase